VQLADEAICIGGPKSADSYLRADRIISAAEIADVDAIHPGYGFLSENAKFAEQCESCNIKFIGPKSKSIKMMGDKAVAKDTVRKAGVPTVPGSDGPVESEAEAVKVRPQDRLSGHHQGRRRRRWPRHAHRPQRRFLRQGIPRRPQRGRKGLRQWRGLHRAYIEKPRHIEFQILADSHGKVLHLGERDCSVQRRHQKLIEESPSPFLTPDLRKKMGKAAIRAAEAAAYENAGTIEFLVDAKGNYYFIEMNTRIQVEHPVTEEVTGIDLIKQQILVANGEKLDFDQGDITFNKHAIECRINAEDPPATSSPPPAPSRSITPPAATACASIPTPTPATRSRPTTIP
jgi:acetyl-CoA carboxylase biotin carboxylase subunit